MDEFDERAEAEHASMIREEIEAERDAALARVKELEADNARLRRQVKAVMPTLRKLYGLGYVNDTALNRVEDAIKAAANAE